MEGNMALNKSVFDMRICLSTIHNLTGSKTKALTTTLISIIFTPNQIVAPATNTLLTIFNNVKLNASLVFPLAMSKLGKNQATTLGIIPNAEMVMNSALGANFSPKATVIKGSAIAASPRKIGRTIIAVIDTIFT